ncbi:MAG: CoA transferase [Chloroflexi bacterium]|nr:CoA transferase [Chloroflexota bacterium]
MSGPLDGIRVLDMGAFGVGPQSCGMLGLLGADVVRIEPDYGDGCMKILPSISGMGTTYLGAHHNSRSIILGLKNEADKKIAYKLIENVDVIIENRRVGAMDRLGFGYKDAAKINPGIIYISSAAWGHAGPLLKYGGADNFIQAMSGFASLNGQPGGPPEWLRFVTLVDNTGSVAIVQAALVALVYRERTGKGQYVDMDEFSSCLFMQSTRIAEYFADKKTPAPMGNETTKVCPSKAYLTQDKKHLLISALTRRQWVNLCTALEMKELIDDERFSTNNARLQRREEVNDLIQEKIQDKPLVWWRWQLGRHKAAHSPVRDVSDIVQDPDIVDNKYIVTLPSAYGDLKHAAGPWRFSETPLNDMKAPPYMDADRDYVFSLLNGKRPRLEAKQAGGPPLKGLRVIDLTQGISGPICTAQLGSLGAEVVKVERGEGDYSRDWGPKVNGESGIFLQLNHDKKSVVIDYGAPEGLDILRDLVRTADVFIEDLKPGEAESLGFGYDDLTRLKKDLVYCSLYPGGDRGPFLDMEATELEIQGMSGMMRWLGQLDMEPVRIGADLYSSVAGMLTFNALMAAIYNKIKRHRGERIITSRLAVAMYLLHHGIIPMSGVDFWRGYWATGPYDFAATGFKAKDKPIMFGMMTRGEEQARVTFEKFCKEVGLGDKLSDTNFVEKSYRTLGMGRDIQEVKPIFEEAFKNWEAEKLVDLIDKCGGLAGMLLTYPELFGEPLHGQVVANRMVVEQEHPRAGRIRLINNPWRHAETVAEIRLPAPALGEHTAEVLAAIGYPKERIAALKETGAIK